MTPPPRAIDQTSAGGLLTVHRSTPACRVPHKRTAPRQIAAASRSALTPAALGWRMAPVFLWRIKAMSAAETRAPTSNTHGLQTVAESYDSTTPPQADMALGCRRNGSSLTTSC